MFLTNDLVSAQFVFVFLSQDVRLKSFYSNNLGDLTDRLNRRSWQVLRDHASSSSALLSWLIVFSFQGP